MQRRGQELRIEHEEVLREQSAVPDEPAALPRHTRTAVQKIR